MSSEASRSASKQLKTPTKNNPGSPAHRSPDALRSPKVKDGALTWSAANLSSEKTCLLRTCSTFAQHISVIKSTGEPCLTTEIVTEEASVFSFYNSTLKRIRTLNEELAFPRVLDYFFFSKQSKDRARCKFKVSYVTELFPNLVSYRETLKNKRAHVAVLEPFLRGLLQALAVAHKNGIYHADINPRSVLVSSSGSTEERLSVRITGWGGGFLNKKNCASAFPACMLRSGLRAASEFKPIEFHQLYELKSEDSAWLSALDVYQAAGVVLFLAGVPLEELRSLSAEHNQEFSKMKMRAIEIKYFEESKETAFVWSVIEKMLNCDWTKRPTCEALEDILRRPREIIYTPQSKLIAREERCFTSGKKDKGNLEGESRCELPQRGEQSDKGASKSQKKVAREELEAVGKSSEKFNFLYNPTSPFKFPLRQKGAAPPNQEPAVCPSPKSGRKAQIPEEGQEYVSLFIIEMQAKSLVERGEYDKAVNLLMEIPGIIGEKEEYSVELLSCLVTLGSALFQQGKAEEALDVFVLLIKYRRKFSEHNMLQKECSVIEQLGEIYKSTEKLCEGIAFLRDLTCSLELEIKREDLSECEREYYEILNSKVLSVIGALHFAKGNLDKCVACFKNALKFRKKQEGNMESVLILHQLGNAYSAAGKVDKALKVFLRILKISNENVVSPERIALFNNIANVYEEKRDYQTALGYYEKALGMARSLLGENSVEAATCLGHIANVHFRTNRLKESLSFHEQAMRIYLLVYGEESKDTAATINNIANIYFKMGKYNLSLENHIKALNLKIKTVGEADPSTINSMSNISFVYKHMGEIEKSLEFQKRLLKITENHYGESHPLTYESRSHLADLYKSIFVEGQH